MVTFFGLQPGEPVTAVAVAIDSASRIVVAGGFTMGPRSCVLARLLPDGSRDPSFGANGVVRQNIDDSECWYNDVAIQADGKIVAFGDIDAFTEQRAVLVRYTEHGIPDPTFGNDGLVLFEPAPITSGMAMTLDAQQRIVVVGQISEIVVVGQEEWFFLVRRYLPDGSLDPSFGVGGVAEQAFGFGADVAYDVAVQQDGKIVVIGGVSPGPGADGAAAIVRYNDDGTKDASFGSLGELNDSFDGDGGLGGLGVIIDPLGRSVVVGGFQQHATVARLMSDGSFDPTFGAGGITVDDGKPHLGYRRVALDEDKLLAVGGSVVGPVGMSQVVLARYTAGGVRDPTFGANGFAHDLPLPPGWQLGHDLAVQPDRRIVVVGWYANLSSADIFVARYCP